MKLIDLSHAFDDAMPVYPGDPGSEISRLTDIPGAGFALSQVKMGMHTGTHMDSPRHMIENGKSISEIPVEKFIGRGVLIDARGKERIDDYLLLGVHLQQNDIVLVLTGFSRKYRHASYYRDYPDMTESFAGALVKAGVNIVGLDTAGPDRTPFPIHRKLLSADVLIIENLTNLESLLGMSTFEVCALPVKFKTEAAPVRVIALVNESA